MFNKSIGAHAYAEMALILGASGRSTLMYDAHSCFAHVGELECVRFIALRARRGGLVCIQLNGTME